MPGGALAAKARQRASRLRLQGHVAPIGRTRGIDGNRPLMRSWQPCSGKYHSFRKGIMVDRLTAMEAFVRVVDARSCSGAAKQLRVGQAAVSKAVPRTLEGRLGVPCCCRSTHGLTLPTEAGRNFYDRAKRSIEEAEEAGNRRAQRRSGAHRVHCGFPAPVTFARLQIMPRLPSFFAENPALEVDLVLEDRSVELDMAAGIDVVALWMGPFGSNSSLIGRKIAMCRRVVVGAPRIFRCHGCSPEPDERPSPGIRPSFMTSLRAARPGPFVKDRPRFPVTVNGRLRVSAAEGVREAVFAGLGVSVGGSEWMFPHLLNWKSGAKVKVVLEDWSCRRPNFGRCFRKAEE